MKTAGSKKSSKRKHPASAPATPTPSRQQIGRQAKRARRAAGEEPDIMDPPLNEEEDEEESEEYGSAGSHGVDS